MTCSVVGMVLVPRACDGAPQHSHWAAPAPGGGVRSCCGCVSPSDARRGWRLVGPLIDRATCPHCQQTGKVCALCGRPILRRQSRMTRPDGRWLHMRPCMEDAHDDL